MGTGDMLRHTDGLAFQPGGGGVRILSASKLRLCGPPLLSCDLTYLRTSTNNNISNLKRNLSNISRGINNLKNTPKMFISLI